MATWLLFCAVMYLILAEAIRPWCRLPDLGNIGFTLVFVSFSIFHCTVTEGWKRTAVFFAASAVICYVSEEIGVRTGVLFGPYHYGNLLGPRLGDVPVIIPLAYFMMVYPSWMVAKALVSGIDTDALKGLTAQAVIAAIVVTAWDAVMDPSMAAAGNWIWERGGVYFGVPRRNFFGWLVTAFLVFWIAGLLRRGMKRKTATKGIFFAMPAVVYAFFALRYVTANRFAALTVVAVFAMGLPAILALLRISMARRESDRVVLAGLDPEVPEAHDGAMRGATRS